MGGFGSYGRAPPYETEPQLSKYNIVWYRASNYRPTCWFTDNSLHLVDSVQAKYKVALLIEPPAICQYSYDYIKQNHHKFDYVLTYSIELVDIDPKKFLWCAPLATSWLKSNEKMVYPKSKMVSIIARPTKNITEGHKLRHQIIAAYRHKLDVFGGGSHTSNPKLPMLRDYMFSFAIINSVYDDYYTEILTDCFATGTVPIFWGTHNITKYFYPEGMIIFYDFNQVAEILVSLNHELYVSKLPAIERNFRLVCDYEFPEDYLYERFPFLFR